MQNQMLFRLKQSLIEKEYSNRFTELLQPNIRVNKDEKLQIDSIIQTNALLPSISNSKLQVADRTKSHSAKRLPTKQQLDKNKHTKSSKKLFNDTAAKSQKVEFDDLIIKKQQVAESSHGKQNFIRTKVFSLKTPQKEGDQRQTTQTKDLTKEGSNTKTDRTRHMSIKQFSTRMDRLNEQIYLPLKMGKIDSQNPDYKKLQNFMTKLKKTNESDHTKLQQTIHKITIFIRKHKIKHGVLQFKKIMVLSSRKVLSNYQMVNVFMNKNDIIANHKIIGLQYYTIPEIQGQKLAAMRVTSLFKMIFSKRFYKNLVNLLRQVKIIQKHWRMMLLVKRTRKKMLQNIDQKIKRHDSLQKQLKSQWNIIKTCQRYEIHVCSYSMQQFKRLTIKSLKQKQNNQITRIFKAYQTDVNIIYVLPFQMQEEIIRYYQSIFGFNPVSIQEKIFFVVPENRARIEQYCPITTVSALLYSPKALKRIRQIIGKQHAYIVPSFPSIQYTNLSAQLNVPVLAPKQNIAKLYSTKSGGIKILSNASKKQKCPFSVPKSVVSIFSQKQLMNTLSILIFRNKEVKTWYLKIQDEIHSRGLAYLNINKIAFLRQICSGSSQFQEVQQTQMIKLIVDELSSKLRNRLKIINKDVYANYDQYISHFLTRGGVVQAGIQNQNNSGQFSINFLIEPSGQFGIYGTYNKLQLGGKSINQTIKFPSLLNNIDYQGITRHIYKELFIRNNLFGFFTVDFIQSAQNQKIYAVGIDCYLNQKASSIFMINFACRTKYDKDKNLLLNSEEQPKYFTYCPALTLTKMPAMIPFFKNCKFQNISYDLEKKAGTIFVIIDRIQNEQIGFLAVQDSEVLLLKQLKKIVEYFCKAYRPSKNSHDEIGLLKGSVTTSLRKHQKQKSNKIPNLEFIS